MRAFAANPTPTAFFPHLPPERARRAPSRFWRWPDRQRQRSALARLDERVLADIGVSRAEADVGCARWD
ncbi:MAG: DUF1127 domain-containing protein [Pseudomonadota bacterium]